MSLEKYKEKRNFNDTPEPVGARDKKEEQLIFVIQRHKASHLHYDFRLELDGVLKSWAVPKGPSLNAADKRLAMMVEDHPYDYKDFEGVIPDGNYGAGIVEIWDSGTYDAVDEKGPERIVTDYKKKIKLLQAGLHAGNLKISMNGKKLKGEFALVKLKGNDRGENSWLLLKHKDKFSVTEPYNSEEITPKNSPINKWLAEHGKPKRGAARSKQTAPVAEAPAKKTSTRSKDRKLDDYIPAMLAKDTDKPFSDAEWIYEIKWDGYRAIAEVDNGEVKLYSRNGNSFLGTYPIVVDELKKIEVSAVLDGEIVVINESGSPDFQKLQHYEENKHLPIQYQVFDLLELNGQQTYELPLVQRKELLRDVLDEDNAVIKYSDHVVEAGEAFFEVAKEKDLEGVMAKKADSHYYPGKRTNEWLKIKHHKSDEAIICGFTAPRGGRKYFGALVLGVKNGDKLEYIGHTGSGFDEKGLKELWGKLEPLITEESPFAERVKTNQPVTWVQPKYVCELKFTEWTSDGKLRHPIFLRLREDKTPDDVRIDKTKVGAKKPAATQEIEVVIEDDEVKDEVVTDAEPASETEQDEAEIKSKKISKKKPAAKADKKELVSEAEEPAPPKKAAKKAKPKAQPKEEAKKEESAPPKKAAKKSKPIEELKEEAKKEEPAPPKKAAKKAKPKAQPKEEAKKEEPAPPKKAAKKVAAPAVKEPPVKEESAPKKLEKQVKAAQTQQPEVVDNPKEKTYIIDGAEVKTTNRTKVFFPEEGFTKGDVIDYYDRMADYILPYLKDRPESLFRTPNGIGKGGFFQKDAAADAPKWVDHIALYSDSVKRDIDYIMCNNKASLLYMANLGCIEINPWHSTTEDLDNPDYLIIDIDPSDNNTFEDVIQAANVVKGILDKAGATGICKTSGATGIHVYVPTGKQYSYDQVKDFAYVICMMANAEIPAITTLERSLSKRSKSQIYMDYLQNRKGQTIASVYSLRPKPGATVSTPLRWEEVKPGLNPKDFNINTIEARLKKTGDMFGEVLKKPIDLLKCIENLGG